MKQISLASSGFELSIKRTRKREFLDEMNQVIPWQALHVDLLDVVGVVLGMREGGLHVLQVPLDVCATRICCMARSSALRLVLSTYKQGVPVRLQWSLTRQ